MSSSRAPPESLRQQLLAWLLAPLLAVLVINAILSYHVAIETADGAFDRLLLASVRAIADRVTVTGGEVQVDIPYVALELFESNLRERIFYRVSTTDGATLTGYEDLPPPPPAAHDHPVFFRSEYKGERIYQAAVYKKLYDPATRAEVLIQVAETAESRDELSRRILYDGLMRQGVVIAFAVLLVALGVRFALRPLLRVSAALSGRASTDITPVDASGVQEEVRPLIEAINLHAGRIDRMMAARVGFVTDAAHQIRTRLTILRTQIEYGLRLDDAAAIHAVLTEAQAAVDESGRFFNQLLVLAHAQAAAVPGRDVQDVDIAHLAHEATLEWVPEARRKEIALGYDGPEHGEWVNGHAVLLKELLANLLDNAIRYTPRGGNVGARIRRDGERVAFEVEDDGPGIAAEDRERVFERFYRAPGSSVEGSGLGLAIAREIAHSHGATIELLTPVGTSGLLARVSFPTAPSRSPNATA